MGNEGFGRGPLAGGRSPWRSSGNGAGGTVYGGGCKGVFDTPALEGLASEPDSGHPELGPERPDALFDVFAPTEPG
jgi:hypothetical protein